MASDASDGKFRSFIGRFRSQRTRLRVSACVVAYRPRCRSTGRSETAATESFNGISVRIATARSTIRLAQSSLIRRLRSDGGCSQLTRFSGLIRVSANSVRNRGDTQNVPASSVPARPIRRISSARSKSTKCTSLPGRVAASATGSRARGPVYARRGSYGSDKHRVRIADVVGYKRTYERRYRCDDSTPAGRADRARERALLFRRLSSVRTARR